MSDVIFHFYILCFARISLHLSEKRNNEVCAFLCKMMLQSWRSTFGKFRVSIKTFFLDYFKLIKSFPGMSARTTYDDND